MSSASSSPVRRPSPVGGVAKDQVTGLLAAEDPRRLFEREQYVAVADVGLFDLDACAWNARKSPRLLIEVTAMPPPSA